MKKNIINFIVTIILALVLSQFLPWWSVMVAALLTGLLIPLRSIAVFFIPFLAIAIFWICYSFYLGNANNFILAKKIAVLLPLGGNAYVLMLVTGLVGGIAAGVSAILGKQISVLINSSK